jgi:hypothetical protein
MLDQRAGFAAAVEPHLGEARTLDTPVIAIDELGVWAHASTFGYGRDSFVGTLTRASSALAQIATLLHAAASSLAQYVRVRDRDDR